MIFLRIYENTRIIDDDHSSGSSDYCRSRRSC